MDLSIIIPCHNLERYITPLIISLNAQKFSYQVEIWFVFDSCTDATKEVVKKKLTKEKYDVYFVDCDVHSCGEARNRALDLAKGEYIWFIDGDDWLFDNNAIEILLQTAKHYNSKLLRFQYKSINYKLKLDMMVWQYLFSSELIGETRFPPIMPHEDVEFMRQIGEKINFKVDEIEVPLYFYNFGREGSNMTQYLEKGHIDP